MSLYLPFASAKVSEHHTTKISQVQSSLRVAQPADEMCIKSIFYNTYGDGFHDVTERVETCHPSEMCRHPEIREYHRKLRHNKVVERNGLETPLAFVERKPSPLHGDYLRLPPTPRRSKSPSPSRKHESGIYVNGTKVVDISGSKKRHSAARGSERDRVILHAPEPPAPARLTRASTMPVDYTPAESQSHHHGAGRDSHRPTTHYRRHVRGGSEFVFIEDEQEQRSRRRATRRSNTTHGHSSDFSHSDAAASDATPAIGKKLRWDDEIESKIAEQNERISARPSVHQGIKGILKHPQRKNADVYDELRRAVKGLDIGSGSKDRRSPPHSDDGYEYDRDRLRARFDEKPRDRKRRSRVSYGTDIYGYQ